MERVIRRVAFVLLGFVLSFSLSFLPSAATLSLRRARTYQTVSYETVRTTLVDIFQAAATLQEALRGVSDAERKEILSRPEIKRAISALQYGLSLGSTTLRNQVALLAQSKGIRANPELNIGIFQGPMETFDILGNIFMYEGEGVVYYQKGTASTDSFKPFRERYGAKILEFDPADIDSLDSAVFLQSAAGKTPRFIYLNGKGLSEEQGRQIYKLAQIYNLLIIEDITNSGSGDYLLSRNDSEGRVVAIGNFDHYLGEGNPLSYAIAGQEIMRLMEIAMGGLSLHPNAFIQPIVSQILAEKMGILPTTKAHTDFTIAEGEAVKVLLSEVDSRFKPSIIREILKWVSGNLIRMGGGVPAEEFFPYQEITDIIENLTPQEWQAAINGSPEINLRLRQVFARWLETKGIQATADEVLVTNGSQQALDLLGRWVGEEGVIFAESPTYVGLITAVSPYRSNIQHRDLRTQEGLNKLEQEIETSGLEGKRIVLYVTPNFGNPPAGNMWTLEERRNLLEFAKKMRAKGYDLHIVEDDPYGELNYTGKKITDIKELDTEGLVIYFASNSKIFSPGMRVGYIVADKWVLYDFAGLMDEVGSFVPALPQLIIAKFIESGQLDRHIQFLIQEYSKRARAMENALEEYMSRVEGLSWTRAEGGLFITLTVPTEWNLDLMGLLKEEAVKGTVEVTDASGEKVSVAFNYVPGVAFSVDGTSNNKIRLCFSTEPEARIKLGIQALAELIKRHMPQ